MLSCITDIHYEAYKGHYPGWGGGHYPFIQKGLDSLCRQLVFESGLTHARVTTDVI